MHTKPKNQQLPNAIEQSIYILNESRLDPLFQATERMFKDADLLKSTAETKINCINAQGWQFENLEVLKFNQDAMQKSRFDLFAATTDGMGRPHDPADILIQDRNGNILREAQLKSCNSAPSSAFALADEKYDSMQRVAPAEQHDRIQELYQKRIEAGTLKANDYQDAQNHLAKGVSHDGVGSEGTTHQEAIDATAPAHAEAVSADFKQKALLTELHQTGHQAGLIGATVGGSVAVIHESLQLYNGQNKDFGLALLRTSTIITQSYITSYATSVAARGIAHAAEQNLASTTTHAFVKSNGHIALAVSMVKASKSLYRYMTDETMTNEELLSDINHISLTGAGAFYYGAVGQLLIPIPIVGALVGSTVGYFIGNMIHQSGLVSLGEAANVKVARQRREMVENFCLAAVPQMRAERLKIQLILEKNKIARQAFIGQIFDDLDKALMTTDADQYLRTLTALNGAFGADLGFQTMAEFNHFMEDDDFVFEL